MTSPQQWPDSVPTLIDPDRRVVLRAHRPDDLDRIVEMCSDPEWTRWTTVPRPYGRLEGHSFLNTFVPAEVNGNHAMIWALEAIPCTTAGEGGPPQFCGTVEIRFHGDGRGEIAFGLHPDARGSGLMRRAGRLALDWAFDSADLLSVQWRALVGHWASRHVAAGLGFRFEGVRRMAHSHRGRLVDCWSATALASEPRISVAPPRQPLVRGNTLALRPFDDRDLDRIVEAAVDPLSQRWLGQLPASYDLDSARAFVEECREGAASFDHWAWCVAAADDDRCLGAVTLFGLQDPAGAGEIGYWTHPDTRGRGVAGTAARMVTDLALGELPLHSITIRVAVGNHASQAVATGTGATLVGRLPEAEKLRAGGWTDLLLFSRVRGRTDRVAAPRA